MNFKQILVKYNPIDCKTKLNKMLAEVERNFGVFSPDMELDIRSIISVSEVLEYFERIIHESHPVLEYDQIDTSRMSKTKEDEKEARKIEKKKRKKEAKKVAKKNLLSPVTMDRDDYGKSPIPSQPVRLSKTDKMLRELAKNGRDYSKPTLESQISRSRKAEGKERPKQWLKIVSVPMGGLNKKH